MSFSDAQGHTCEMASNTTHLMGRLRRPHDGMGETQLNQHLECTDPPHVGTLHKWSVFAIMVRKAEAQSPVVLAPGILLPTFMPTTRHVYPGSAQCRSPSLIPLAWLQRRQNWVLSTAVHTFSPDLPVTRQSQKPGQAHAAFCPLGLLKSCAPVSRGCRQGWGAAKYGKIFSPH